MLEKGARCWYTDQREDPPQQKIVTVAKVHYDDVPPYYTIVVDGKERATVRDRLALAPPEAEAEAPEAPEPVKPAASRKSRRVSIGGAVGPVGGGGGGGGGGGKRRILQGWVWKVKAGRDTGEIARKVERRWAMLRGSELLYFTDASLRVLKRRVSLPGLRVAAPNVKRDAILEAENAKKNSAVVRYFLAQRKYPVVLQGMDSKALDLVVAWPTRTEHQTWMKALRAAAHGGARVQQGWLHKQGGAKSGVAAHGWRRRHFVLQPTRGELAYYDSRDALRPLGEISLAGVRLHETPSERRSAQYPHSFLLSAKAAADDDRSGRRSSEEDGGGGAPSMSKQESWMSRLRRAAMGTSDVANYILAADSAAVRDEWLAALAPHASFVEPSIKQAAAAIDRQSSAGGIGPHKSGFDYEAAAKAYSAGLPSVKHRKSIDEVVAEDDVQVEVDEDDSEGVAAARASRASLLLPSGRVSARSLSVRMSASMARQSQRRSVLFAPNEAEKDDRRRRC